MNVAAMGLVGDGLLTALQPRRESLLWKNGPEPYRKAMNYAAQHPSVARSFGLFELGLGLWLGIRSSAR